MASTKKRTTTKTSASAKTGASASRKGRTSAAKKQQQPDGYLPRPVWGLIYAVIGIIILLTLFKGRSDDGVVLHLLYGWLSALLGRGLWLLPVALFGLTALLMVRRKGPVRLRGVSLGLLPLLGGALIHGISCANRFPAEMSTFSALLESGGKMESGGLLAGGLYCLLEWGFSSIGGFLILLLLTGVDLLVIFRLTPQVIYEAFKPIDYEYEDEEERAKYEAPPVLPNVHEVAQARRARRAAKPVIDIPLDDEPITPPEPTPPPMAPDEFLAREAEKEQNRNLFTPEKPEEEDDPFGDILTLLDNRPTPAEEPQAAEEPVQPADIPAAPAAAEPAAASDADLPPWEEKPDKKQMEKENAALAAQINQNAQAPVPVYSYPPLDLLQRGKPSSSTGIQSELAESRQCLVDTLQSFNIEASVIGIVRGPSVTRFEITIPRGIKFSRVTSLSDDIALSLGAVSVRIAPIPEKGAIGIEVPNKNVQMVPIREVISSSAFQAAKSRLSFAVGKDITGAPVVGDIAKMPHLLIAGTTGSGKSVCINSMLISLLYKSTPEEVRLIMVDPKMVELGNYNGIPHLLIPVVTDPHKAAGALNWAVMEMERRYKLFAENQVRNLSGYNDIQRRKRADAMHTEGENPDAYQVLPQIVIVIDELADLMMVAAKEVETSICRIAQKARAAGMHLIVATQRPSADVITGIMKANIPSRIAFAVASQIESRIILDGTGAEKLIGKGDMLYAPLGGGKHQRIQGCFISNDEIEAVIAYIKSTSTAEYNEEILEHIERRAAETESGGSGGGDLSGDEDEMLQEAIDIVMDCGQASASMLQRRLKLGYARAARIVDQMEERGIVGPNEGSKPRQILISKDDWKEMKLRRQDLP